MSSDSDSNYSLDDDSASDDSFDDSLDYDDETKRLAIITDKQYINFFKSLHHPDLHIHNERGDKNEVSSTSYSYKFREMCIHVVLERYESDAYKDYLNFFNMTTVTSKVDVDSYINAVRLGGDYPYTVEHPLLIRIGLNSRGRFKSSQRDNALLLITELRDLLLEMSTT